MNIPDKLMDEFGATYIFKVVAGTAYSWEKIVVGKKYVNDCLTPEEIKGKLRELPDMEYRFVLENDENGIKEAFGADLMGIKLFVVVK